MTNKGLYGAGGGSAASSASFSSKGGHGQRGAVRIIYPTPQGQSDTTTILDRGLPTQAAAASTPPALEFLGSVNVGDGLSTSINVSTSSLSTPTASSYAIIVTAGAQNDAYTALTDANSNTYTNHASQSDGEYAIIFGTNAEVTSMPSTLNFSSGGNRLAIGVYALSGASSLTPVDTYVSLANRQSPVDLDLTTQVGDVFVAVMGHEDQPEGTCVHTSDGSADIEDWDINPGGCRGVGGSGTAVGTTTDIRFTSGSNDARACAVAAAWR